IGRPRRDQRPERDLKGPGRDARGPPTPVEVDRIVPDPDGVIEAGGPSAGVERSGDVLLADRPPRAEAPAFANVRDLGEAVRAPHDVGPGTELGVSASAVVPRRLGLEPVEESQAEPAGPLAEEGLLVRGAVDQGS